MNTIDHNDFSIIFDKVKQYNDENLLSDNDFLKPEEIITNEEIRNLSLICQELNESSNKVIVYRTFF